MENFKITKREVLFSIIVILVMLAIGFVIHGNISDSLIEKYSKYDTALQIQDDRDLFEYGMKTGVGNAFVYGDLKAVDTVSYPEIKGEYSYIEKVKEKYTRHTRTVTKTRTNSKGETETYTETETYWTWDAIDRESKHSKEISFCGVVFKYGTIRFLGAGYIDTVRESSIIRYKYYGSKTECTGTLFANLQENTIKDTSFYNGQTIEQTIDSLESDWQLFAFWLFWILLTTGAVFGFCYFENKWLE